VSKLDGNWKGMRGETSTLWYVKKQLHLPVDRRQTAVATRATTEGTKQEIAQKSEVKP